ncbi:unnamed protein product [Ixodes pacificus]
MSLPQALRVVDNSHVNRAFAAEVCDCDSSSATPDGCSEKSYEPDWVDKIGPGGELFYIEPRYQPSFEIKPFSSTKSSTSESQASHSSKSFSSEAKSKLKSLVGLKKTKGNFDLPQNGHLNARNERGASFRGFGKAECHEMLVDVDPKRNNYGRRATLCETLFGIIPGRLAPRLATAEALEEGSPIMVQGLIPDGEALRSGVVKIGDVLRSIDGSDVNENNVDAVLRNITKPQKVKLQFLRLEENSLSERVKFPFSQDLHQRSQLMKQLSGDEATVQEIERTLREIPHAFIYQELRNDSSSFQQPSDHNQRNEHFYRYPNYDHTLSNLKGMFVTLSSVLAEVTAAKPQSSSLTVDGHLVHVAFSHEGSSLVVLALPASCATPEEMRGFVTEVVQLLKFESRSLSLAFKEVENHARVDLFFLHFFHELLAGSRPEYKRSCRFSRALHLAPWLPLPAEVQGQVDSVLSELESADFGDTSEAFYESQRLFTFLGSCVFYKGYLLANHLTKADLENVFLYCRHYQLLSLMQEEYVGQVVVWKEVFLPQSQTENRNFLLITGLKHSLLAALLEVGGCSSVPEDNPAPDAFYIDLAQNALLQLDSNGVVAIADDCLKHRTVGLGSPTNGTKSQRPSIAGTDSPRAADGQGIRATSQSNLSLTGPPSPSARRRSRGASDVDMHHLLRVSAGHLDASEQEFQTNRSHSSCEDSNLGSRNRHCSLSTASFSDCDSRTSGSDAYQSRDPRLRRIFASSYDLSSLRRSLEDSSSSQGQLAPLQQQRARGEENLLFHYLNLELAEGIFVAPVDCALENNLGAQIVENFNRCCLAIREVFRCTAKGSARTTGEDERESESKFAADRSLSCVREHGVLFTCSAANSAKSKAKAPVSYWVVGRLFSDRHQPREAYVCVHENASATALEMAFRLSFGLQI